MYVYVYLAPALLQSGQFAVDKDVGLISLLLSDCFLTSLKSANGIATYDAMLQKLSLHKNMQHDEKKQWQ